MSLLDEIPPEARRALVRAIRENDVPLGWRALFSLAFVSGYGAGMEDTALKFSADARKIREQYVSLHDRVEALTA